MGDVAPIRNDGEVPADGPQSFGRALELIEELREDNLLLRDSANTWRLRYERLQSQHGQSIKHDPLYDAVKGVHDYWRKKCNHPRTKLDKKAFELSKPIVREYGIEMCKRAVDGCAFDHFEKVMKNGKIKHYDEFTRIFSHVEKFTDYCNRSPEPYHAGDYQSIAETDDGRQQTLGGVE